jgi:raffinose/stachyose/melibiose transport system permease protein
MKNPYARALSTLVMGFFALICIYPLIWVLLNSFKPTIDIVSGKSFRLPETIMLENYRVSIFEKNIFRFFGNSMIITLLTIVVTVIFACMLAYASTRMIWKHGGFLLALVTLGILLPSQIVVAPVFILIRSLKLVNTRIALVLTVSAFNLSISTLIASGFLRSIPSEVEEAAVIDGGFMLDCRS